MTLVSSGNEPIVLIPDLVAGGVLREAGGDDQREVREDDEVQAESSHAGTHTR